MDRPRVVSRAEWLVARKELLTAEKEFTRQRDALSARRRALPMVKIEKEYAFDGPNGRTAWIRHHDKYPAWKQAGPIDEEPRRVTGARKETPTCATCC